MTEERPETGLEEAIFSSFVLSLDRVVAHRIIPKAVREQGEVTSYLDMTMEDMVIEVAAWVAVDQIVSETLVVERPYEVWGSWWQHTKAACPPLRWLSTRLGRPPVTQRRYVAVEFNARQVFAFPDASIYPVDLGEPILVERVTWRPKDGS